MKIRITKGSGWYGNKVGEIYKVIRMEGFDYVVWQSDREVDDYDFVSPEDCKELAAGHLSTE